MKSIIVISIGLIVFNQPVQAGIQYKLMDDMEANQQQFVKAAETPKDVANTVNKRVGQPSFSIHQADGKGKKVVRDKASGVGVTTYGGAKKNSTIQYEESSDHKVKNEYSFKAVDSEEKRADEFLNAAKAYADQCRNNSLKDHSVKQSICDVLGAKEELVTQKVNANKAESTTHVSFTETEASYEPPKQDLKSLSIQSRVIDKSSSENASESFECKVPSEGRYFKTSDGNFNAKNLENAQVIHRPGINPVVIKYVRSNERNSWRDRRKHQVKEITIDKNQYVEIKGFHPGRKKANVESNNSDKNANTMPDPVMENVIIESAPVAPSVEESIIRSKYVRRNMIEPESQAITSRNSKNIEKGKVGIKIDPNTLKPVK